MTVSNSGLRFSCITASENYAMLCLHHKLELLMPHTHKNSNSTTITIQAFFSIVQQNASIIMSSSQQTLNL
jgi:hypothetical protein